MREGEKWDKIRSSSHSEEGLNFPVTPAASEGEEDVKAIITTITPSSQCGLTSALPPSHCLTHTLTHLRSLPIKAPLWDFFTTHLIYINFMECVHLFLMITHVDVAQNPLSYPSLSNCLGFCTVYKKWC